MYKLQENTILRTTDNCSFQEIEGTPEYDLYKIWLSEGNTPQPQFTSEELSTQRISAIKSEAGRIILEAYPQFKQINAQLGVYGAEYLVAMVAFITGIKTQSDALELDVTKTKDDFIVGAING